MFGKNPYPTNETVDSIVGKETVITGNLSSTGTIRVDGQVEGDIAAQGDVIIGQSGKANSNVKAANAVIAGEICGNVEVQNKLEILATGKLNGDISAANLVIAEGAAFKGNCHMNKEQEKLSTQPKKNAKM